MATRILGPTGSRRRRRFLFVPVLVVACSALLLAGSARAVHDTGLFQLDGNAQQSVNSTPSAIDDWDNICAAHKYTGTATTRQVGEFCQKSPTYTLPAATTLPDRSTFIQDGFDTKDNIYKGGTDDGEITPGWLWKQAKPSPDKDNIENAFAAQYTCTAARVTAGTCSSTYSGHKLIFFGGSRFANNGNTQIGLWLLRNPVSVAGSSTVTDSTTGAVSCPVTSGCGFTGTHSVGNCSLPTHPNPCTPGDLLIESAFLVGGAQPTIQVFEWVGPGNATVTVTNARTLQPVPIPIPSGQTDNRCDGASQVGDQACALVNTANITSPWLFSGKNAAQDNVMETSEFYEGGIDLTALGFGAECTSTVLLNSRSSGSSLDSVAQDFALGQFGKCGSELHTTAAGPTGDGTIGGGSVSSGTDSATLDVTGISSWSGTLSFYICGPFDSGTCSDGGVLVSSGTVNQGTTQPISSAAVQNNNNGTATLTKAGRYCWFAKFASSTTGVPNATDDGTPVAPATTNLECFTVGPVTPSLDTQAVLNANGDAIPTGYKTPFGSAVFDTATLSGAAKEPGSNGGNTTYPTINATNGQYAGTIQFKLLGPDDCTTTATGTGNNPQSVNVDTTTGNKTYGPVSFTPNHAGTFHWIATYTNTGSANNTSPVSHNTSCDDADEDVVVQQIPTEIKTAQSWFPNDRATITSTVTGDNLVAGGHVDFTLYDTATCTGTVKYTERQDLAGGSHSEEVSTHNYTGSLAKKPDGTTVSPFSVTTDYGDLANTANGPFSWKVTYTPLSTDSLHTGKQSSCTAGSTEKFSITYTNDPGPGTALP